MELAKVKGIGRERNTTLCNHMGPIAPVVLFAADLAEVMPGRSYQVEQMNHLGPLCVVLRHLSLVIRPFPLSFGSGSSVVLVSPCFPVVCHGPMTNDKGRATTDN